ncbi:DUF692 family multinuclear iron-containing protein [Actinomadura fibrosa]|uniref:DUF692 family multinuclear iron-containing protein n=1 Tax=Actinomadura fibrosa TaxID=111802 RepID=A0ABW2XWI7_9ACTN
MTVLPDLGSGLGHRAELADAIDEHAGRIDWLEVITENVLYAPADDRERLRDLARRFPVVPHGVELSIGSDREPDPGYVEALADLVEEIDAPWFSDHLCFTRTDRIALGLLAPLPRTSELARRLGRKAQRVQDAVGRPFLLENITYYVDMATPLTEAQFIAEVMEHCDCGLLLDLANLDINARNHGFDPLEFLDTVPVERVVQVHLAGGYEAGADPGATTDTGTGDGAGLHAAGDAELAIDSHATQVPDRVWDLLDELLARTHVNATLVERDQRFPDDFGELLAEVDRARAALRNAQGAAAVPPSAGSATRAGVR